MMIYTHDDEEAISRLCVLIKLRVLFLDLTYVLLLCTT